MSSQLGCELPDVITGIGPVAGVRFPAPCPGRAVPVITIHGLADTTNAYAGEGPTHRAERKRGSRSTGLGYEKRLPTRRAKPTTRPARSPCTRTASAKTTPT